MLRTITVNGQKFVLLMTGMICVTALMMTHTIEPAVGMPVLSGVVLYGIGNGVAAATGKTSEPIVKPIAQPE